MLKMTLATLFIAGLTAGLPGCPGAGAGEGEGEGGEGEGAGEGEGEGGGEGEGEGGGGAPAHCGVACAVDGDCGANEACLLGSCAARPAPCTTDDACTTSLSGWVTACAANSDCPGQVCFDNGGAGVCAFLEGAGCAVGAPLAGQDIAGAAVSVCANAGKCVNNNICLEACSTDPDCTTGKCDVAAGFCQFDCVTSADCTGAQSVCVDIGAVTGVAGFNGLNACGCADDTECTTASQDVCHEGLCSCSSDAVCTNAGETCNG